jgi:hypothetical protein
MSVESSYTRIAQQVERARLCILDGNTVSALHWIEQSKTSLREAQAQIEEDRDALVERGLAMASDLSHKGLPGYTEIAHLLCESIIVAHAARDVAKRELRMHKEDEAGGGFLGGAAVQVIREMLDTNYVPQAAFIDDYVGNAIVQRNKLIENYRVLRDKLLDGSVPLSKSDILKCIDEGFTAAYVDARILSNVEEEGRKDS